ncbi:MAG: LacI family DNA-binding transcriptional regulator [Christensenella sp.]|nr:LacI family DNA-binding transcriptional regulator [Christensenella sp.]
MTIREIARLANVSPATISLVLNNKPGVGDETRKRVQSILKEYDYKLPPKNKVPMKNIRFLKYKDHSMVVDGNAGFISAIIDAVEAECREMGYNLIITTVKGGFKQALKILQNDTSDGIILLGSEISEADYPKLKLVQKPMVVVDNILAYEPYECVVMNNKETTYCALKYLAELGHKAIAYFQSATESSNFKERSEAFYTCCERLSLTCDHRFLLTPTLDGAYESMKKYIGDGAVFPTAAFADNDTIALGAMKALQEVGFRIPEDISIMGFDDIPYCTISDPPLTTMRIPRRRIGKLAVRRLCERMQESPINSNVKILVGSRLVERQSTCPPKK